MQSVAYDSEAELLAACRRQDLRAFEQLYHAHAGCLKSLAYQMLGSRQDAEDAVQETFIKLYKSIGGFHGESSMRTWLCRILINVSHDLSRKRKRESQPEEQIEHAAPPAHLPVRAAIEQALHRIHPRHRMVFLLFEVEGFRHAEIATIMEIPEGTSKAWLFEAKKELKRMLTGGPR